MLINECNEFRTSSLECGQITKKEILKRKHNMKPPYPTKHIPSDGNGTCLFQERNTMNTQDNQWIPADEVKAMGLPKFNGGAHHLVDIPTDHSTIIARLPDGSCVTFAFVPYKNGGAPRCVDIKEHHNGKQFEHDTEAKRKCQSFKVGEAPEQQFIVFAGGLNETRAHGTLGTLILHNED